MRSFGVRRAVAFALASLGAFGAIAACVGDDNVGSPPAAVPDATPADGPVVDAPAGDAGNDAVDDDAPAVDAASTGFCARNAGASACEDFDEDTNPVPAGWQTEQELGGTLLLVASDLSKPFALQSRLAGGDAGPQSARVKRAFASASPALELRIELQMRVVKRTGALVSVPLVYVRTSATSFFNVAATASQYMIEAAFVKEADAGVYDISNVASETDLSPLVWHHFVITLKQGATGGATAQVNMDGNNLIPGDTMPVPTPRIDGSALELKLGAFAPAESGIIEVEYENVRVDLK
jgi:hypothetical protein